MVEASLPGLLVSRQYQRSFLMQELFWLVLKERLPERQETEWRASWPFCICVKQRELSRLAGLQSCPERVEYLARYLRRGATVESEAEHLRRMKPDIAKRRDNCVE